jgi:DUF35 OB-fold domain, acyl-CoA-associated
MLSAVTGDLAGGGRAGPADAAGRLYSWSTVHVSAARATPYTLGYVDLDGGSRVLAVLDGNPDALRIGAPVRVVPGAGGLTFRPAGEPA